MRSWATALVGAAIALSGCAAGEAKATSPAPPTIAPPATATEETGSIEVLVADEELAPLEGVLVALLETNARQTSGADGRAVFENLTEGRYRVVAERLGFESAAKQVEVRLGEVTHAQITLVALDLNKVPFWVMLPFKGMLQCSVNANYAVNPCGGVTGEQKDFMIFTIDRNYTWSESVIELVWTPTTAATGQELDLEVCDDITTREALCLNSDYYRFETNESPIMLRLTDMPKTKSTFLAGVGAGFGSPYPTFQQPFDLYVTLCYFEECADDYSAVPAS